ncbi:hypothetical protein KEM54_002099 [Ascosphaera aggregata]|nr:hypothetical protein KEM54_002099 [Ascosphaera aggregata]
MSSSSPVYRYTPKGLLFDIGGVCVLSPMQAILDYERQSNIPIGWINYSLQANSPSGAWHRLERGEIKLDKGFFEQFNADFVNVEIWRTFLKKKGESDTSSDIQLDAPPRIDGKALFWSMMDNATRLDPWMFPALVKLKESRRFVIGALSNTTILPDQSHPSSDDLLKSQFDFFISSAHTGLRKPEPAIYEAAYEAMNDAAREKGWWRGEEQGEAGIKREEIVFLDDIRVNLKGAKDAGFKTVKVTMGKVTEAVRQLEELTGMKLLEREVREKL